MGCSVCSVCGKHFRASGSASRLAAEQDSTGVKACATGVQLCAADVEVCRVGAAPLPPALDVDSLCTDVSTQGNWEVGRQASGSFCAADDLTQSRWEASGYSCANASPQETSEPGSETFLSSCVAASTPGRSEPSCETAGSSYFPFFSRIVRHLHTDKRVSLRRGLSSVLGERKGQSKRRPGLQELPKGAASKWLCAACSAKRNKSAGTDVMKKSWSLDLSRASRRPPSAQLKTYSSASCEMLSMHDTSSLLDHSSPGRHTPSATSASHKLPGQPGPLTEANVLRQGRRAKASKRKRSEAEASDLSLLKSWSLLDVGCALFDSEDSSEDNSVCGCVSQTEDDIYLGIDIPMTNLGLTSDEMTLLF